MSARRCVLSRFNMPAMSPTMTEGGIASWKMKEGETFTAGDVLLEIVWRFSSRISTNFNTYHKETDKATIDVEAQDDGVIAKILVRQSLASRCILLIPPRPQMAQKMSKWAPSLPFLVKKETNSLGLRNSPSRLPSKSRQRKRSPRKPQNLPVLRKKQHPNHLTPRRKKHLDQNHPKAIEFSHRQ